MGTSLADETLGAGLQCSKFHLELTIDHGARGSAAETLS